MENSNKVTLSSIKKYFPAGTTAFLVLACSILFFFAFFKISEISDFFAKTFLVLQPIIFGLVFAYILNPISTKIEKWMLLIPKNKKKDKLIKNISTARGISVFISVVFALLMLFVLANLVVPQLVSSITNLVSDMPSKVDSFLVWIGDVLDGEGQISKILNENIVHIVDMFKNWVENNLLATLQASLGFFLVKTFDVVGVLLDVIVGIIVSVYLIYSKEKFAAQSKKLFYAVLKPKKANILLDILRQSNKIFSGFIIGKIIDSLIIGVICFVVMSVLRMPYTLLISVIVGVTNVIPFFGPFIGAIPSAFLLLLVDPIECLYFVILIIILQQLDGNVIGPKILGDSTGLSAFWVVFAILLFGGLFGFVGMLIGVPVFAVIYYLIDRYINYLLKKNSLPVNTKEYENLDLITESGEIKHLS